MVPGWIYCSFILRDGGLGFSPKGVKQCPNEFIRVFPCTDGWNIDTQEGTARDCSWTLSVLGCRIKSLLPTLLLWDAIETETLTS